jgi:hypothetical protein
MIRASPRPTFSASYRYGEDDLTDFITAGQIRPHERDDNGSGDVALSKPLARGHISEPLESCTRCNWDKSGMPGEGTVAAAFDSHAREG